MGELLARYEWALILPLVLGFAIYELIAVNRSIGRDKARNELDRAKDK